MYFQNTSGVNVRVLMIENLQFSTFNFFLFVPKMTKNGPKMTHFWPFSARGREIPNGLHKLNKWWYTMELIQENYPGCKTSQKSAPSGVKTVPKWQILCQKNHVGGQGGPKWLANVEQMVVLNGIHAGGLPWAQNLSEKCTQ